MILSFDHADDRKLAVAAVREASRLCEAVRSSLGSGVLHKDDRSPVTVADFGSQAIVCRRIGDARPDEPIIAEESADVLRQPDNVELRDRVVALVADLVPGSEFEQVLQWIDRGANTEHADRYWTLDPIDGTKGFLRGDQYAVALALVVDGIPTVAAVACPNLPGPDGSRGVVMSAVRGHGAVQEPLYGGVSTPVAVSATRTGVEARFCESFESGHSSHDDAAMVASALGISRQPIRMDSQAKYAVVARGEADIYLRLPTRPGYVEKIWDHAAGSLLVLEAGGRVSDVDGHELEFFHGSRLAGNRGIIVSNGHVHDRVLAALVSAGVTD